MRILHLTLQKKWFDLILSGEKRIEYRECKPYWNRRLLNKIFDEIRFKNGYAKKSPFMRVKWDGTMIIDPSEWPPENGEVLLGKHFALLLGNILETRNLAVKG